MLSVATGLPWEYFAEQDDAIRATYGEVAKAISGRAPAPPGDGPTDRRVFAEG